MLDHNIVDYKTTKNKNFLPYKYIIHTNSYGLIKGL